MTASRNRVTGMEFRQALGEVIRTERLARKFTMRDLGGRSYVSIGHLSEVERGVKEASSAVIEGLANGLDLETYELILKTGYLMGDLDVPDTPKDLFAHDSIHKANARI